MRDGKTVYQRDELLVIGRDYIISGVNRLPKPTWETLSALGLATTRKTKRGKRGGKRRKRKLDKNREENNTVNEEEKRSEAVCDVSNAGLSHTGEPSSIRDCINGSVQTIVECKGTPTDAQNEEKKDDNCQRPIQVHCSNKRQNQYSPKESNTPNNNLITTHPSKSMNLC